MKPLPYYGYKKTAAGLVFTGIEEDEYPGTISPGMLQFLFICQVDEAPRCKDNNNADTYYDPAGNTP